MAPEPQGPLGLRFLVLGPVRSFHGGTELDLGPPQQRALLASLLLRNGAPASIDELMAAIWPDDLPRTAAGMVRSYISRLRRSIADVGAFDPIRSTTGGYSVRVSDVSFDLRDFLTGLSAARERRRAGQVADAAAHLGRAFALWQGVPLAGVPGAFAQLQRTRLEQLRTAAAEDLAGDEIELGRPAETVDSLVSLVAGHPLRERPRELLMLALYRSGRRADALEAYRAARSTLRDQLGMDPGPALQRMHARVLAGDSDLPASLPPAARVTPAQLPADLPDFVGRVNELRTLTDALRRTGSSVPMVGIDGIGGVGKTALAVHAAHRIARRFPDGQIVVEGDVVGTAFDALGGMIRALTGAAAPDSLAERTAAWRSLTAGRRILLVLDGVRDGSLIRHVMPGAGGAAVLLTSRQKLVEAAGARWLTLGPLSPDETERLLGAIIGESRLRGEPEAARRIAQGTAGLGQAVRAVGLRLVARPQWSLAKASTRILVEMPVAWLRAAECEEIDSPYAEAMSLLAPDAARTLRLLAVSRDWEITVPVAAALLVVLETHAEDLLEALADAHLIEADGDGGYHYLNPVWNFAHRRALIDDGPDDVRAVLSRWHAYRASIASPGR